MFAAKRFKPERVALSGGCFQNRYLTERTIRRLREEGIRPYWHQRIPPNDGGIALGQIVAGVGSARLNSHAERALGFPKQIHTRQAKKQWASWPT